MVRKLIGCGCTDQRLVRLGRDGSSQGTAGASVSGPVPTALPGGDSLSRLQQGQWRPHDVSGISFSAERAQQKELHALLGGAFRDVSGPPVWVARRAAQKSVKLLL